MNYSSSVKSYIWLHMMEMCSNVVIGSEWLVDVSACCYFCFVFRNWSKSQGTQTMTQCMNGKEFQQRLAFTSLSLSLSLSLFLPPCECCDVSASEDWKTSVPVLVRGKAPHPLPVTRSDSSWTRATHRLARAFTNACSVTSFAFFFSLSLSLSLFLFLYFTLSLSIFHPFSLSHTLTVYPSLCGQQPLT